MAGLSRWLCDRGARIAVAAAVLAPLLASCQNTGGISLFDLTYRNEHVDLPNQQPQPSATLWIGATETVDLSWEAVATAVVNNQRYRIGACRNENADPMSSGDFGGLTGIPVKSWPNLFPARFLACNPANFSFATCQQVTNPCGGNLPSDTSFPYCAPPARSSRQPTPPMSCCPMRHRLSLFSQALRPSRICAFFRAR